MNMTDGDAAGPASANPYMDAVLALGQKCKEAFADRKLTRSELAGIAMTMVLQANAIIAEAERFDEQDVQMLIEALQAAYDLYIVPLDLPGGKLIEALEDRAIRDHLIPWAVRGLYEAFQNPVSQ